jgi:ring-1,2-phenylacetyl-CoA epoxidase subunit PaaD
MVMSVHSKEEIFGILSSIPDPEIPVVNIREMGMLRDVILTDKGYEVILTPTYTGCPAMGIIEEDIKARLKEMNVFPVTVKLVYDPAWTTDWMSEEAKEKLKKYGIAPPLASACNNVDFLLNTISCPLCGSHETVLVSRFGSTACKALYKCSSCKEPFEYFKCH